MKNDKRKQFRYQSGIKVDDRYATYFEQVVHMENFNNDVKKIRKEFGIPENGIDDFPSSIKSGNYDEIVKSTDFDIPKHIDNNSDFWDKISLLCAKFYFDQDSWLTLLGEYVVFDSYNPFLFGKGHAVFDIERDLKNNLSFSKAYSKTHPVAILIDPYTSLTELHDLVQNVYKTQIEPIQKKHKEPNNNISKIKRVTSKMVPIYEFIKNNLHLSSVSLAVKIEKIFKVNWDYTRVDKIIREKKYRRKS